jgi:hypothetical protein
MKIKYTLLLTAIIAVVLYTGCRRTTPHDAFLPDPNCFKMGYYTKNYTNYHYGNCIFSSDATLLASSAVITSISANIKGSNTAIAMIYDGATGNLLAQSAQTHVTDGWNKIMIPATVLSAGTYRLAIMTVYDPDSGIRSTEGAGTRYLTGNSWPNVPSSLTGGTSANYLLLMYGNYCK